MADNKLFATPPGPEPFRGKAPATVAGMQRAEFKGEDISDLVPRPETATIIWARFNGKKAGLPKPTKADADAPAA